VLVAFESLIHLSIAVLLIVGAYQFYFLPQRRPFRRSIKFHLNKIDHAIPFVPQWVWVYSGLYYPVILYLVLTVDSFKRFNYTTFNFIILLVIQLTFFYLFPVETPKEWRSLSKSDSISNRFLSFVQKFDSRQNCFPSMHVSVATLTAFHLQQNLSLAIGTWSNLAFAFPLLIGLSTLFTKQHYLIDIPAGFLLGWFCYYLFLLYW